MRTKRKDDIITELTRLIRHHVRKARFAHQCYLAAIRNDNLAEELREYHIRDIHLGAARSLKAALLPYDVDVRFSGNLDLQRKRRLHKDAEREQEQEINVYHFKTVTSFVFEVAGIVLLLTNCTPY